MDLLDEIYSKNHDYLDSRKQRIRYKDNIRIINNEIKAAVASGNGAKIEHLLTKLELAVRELASTYQ